MTEPGFAILHALYWLVARMAERGPLLVAVDDAQWADEPSLRFLLYLAGRLSEHPIAILVGARAGEPAGELLGSWRPIRPRRSGHCRRSELRRWPRWSARASGGRRRALRALLRADRRQPAPGARAARGDRASAAARPTPPRWRPRPSRRPARWHARCWRRLGVAVARRAGAGARGRGVRGRRAVAPRGGAHRPRRRPRRWPPRASSHTPTCCGTAIRSGSRIRSCGRRSTAACRSTSARHPPAGGARADARPARPASG